jgi:hypothetical protein
MTTYIVLFVRRYVTSRNSIIGISIPSSISLPASLFSRSVIRHLVTNSLVTLLARLLWCCITERAQRYLSDRRNDKSQSWSMPTQQTLSEIPIVHLYNHPFTLWRLIHPKYSYGIWELHDLMVGGTCIWHSESSSNKLKWSNAMLTVGSCPSHHSPNDVIPLSNDNSCLWSGNLNHLLINELV